VAKLIGFKAFLSAFLVRELAAHSLISSLKFHPPTSPIIFSLLQFPNQRTKF